MSDARIVMPQLILALGAVAVYVAGRLWPRRNSMLASLTATLFAAALAASLALSPARQAGAWPSWAPADADLPMLQRDPASALLTTVALALGLAVSVYSGKYLALDKRYEYYYPLVLLMSAGMLGMVMAVDLIALYLFTVMTSAASYVLVAFRRGTPTAIEAGFKLLIMSGMAATLALAGIGLVYRQTGSLALPQPVSAMQGWGALGAALLVYAYLVKAAIFPAHTWLPDAHGRAPSSISAILSGSLVEFYLFVLIKVGLGLGIPMRWFGLLLTVLALCTMTVGNIMALRQTYGKRLLAYSSIAQMGYMLLALGVGLVSNRPEPIAAALFLVATHAAMKGLAFLCKGVFHFYAGAVLVDELDGLAARMPVVASCFVVALAALAGLPPLGGFRAKLEILQGLFMASDALAILTVAVFMVNSLISLGYYLPLMGRVLRPAPPAEKTAVSAWMVAPLAALAAVVVFLGVMPGPLMLAARAAARFIITWGPH
ncbi:MAG: complex I subunit 5 family protein [Chloroflexota bacterium]